MSLPGLTVAPSGRGASGNTCDVDGLSVGGLRLGRAKGAWGSWGPEGRIFERFLACHPPAVQRGRRWPVRRRKDWLYSVGGEWEMVEGLLLEEPEEQQKKCLANFYHSFV